MSQLFTRCLQIALCGLTSLAAVNTSPVAAESVSQPENIGYRNNGYIGIGSAIGLGGNTTALSTGGVAILTKVRFSRDRSNLVRLAYI